MTARPQSTYAVTARAVPPSEPSWVVFISGAGAAADSVAVFYDQQEACEYAEWKNEQRKEKP